MSNRIGGIEIQTWFTLSEKSLHIYNVNYNPASYAREGHQNKILSYEIHSLDPIDGSRKLQSTTPDWSFLQKSISS